MKRTTPATIAVLFILTAGILTGFPTAKLVSAAPPPFQVGERFTFRIQYGMIRAGTAVLEVKEGGDEGTWLISSTARTNSFFDVFFKVRDQILSWVSADDLRSIRFHKRLREGSYKKDEFIEFDWDSGVARYADGTEIPVTPDVRDVLSVFYHVRTLRLPIGKDIPIEYHSSKKNWPVSIRVGRVEKIKVPAGEFNCFVIEPELQSVGLFKQTGRMRVWITADKRRMPVKLESKVTFGAFEAVLIDYEA